jgi:hypothetical protein
VPPRDPGSPLPIGDPGDGATRTRTGIVEWTCRRPGGSYSYVITARSRVGPARTSRGHFSPVSAGRCRTLKRREEGSRERNARLYAEELARRPREEREALKRFEANCRALGERPSPWSRAKAASERAAGQTVGELKCHTDRRLASRGTAPKRVHVGRLLDAIGLGHGGLVDRKLDGSERLSTGQNVRPCKLNRRRR